MTDRQPRRKDFLGILFDCCNVYARIYLTQDGTAFDGRCPRCGRRVRVHVAEDGTPGRFLRAQ